MHGEIISISQTKDSASYNVILSDNWTDDTNTISSYANKWIKDKVLTYSELMRIMESYKNNA